VKLRKCIFGFSAYFLGSQTLRWKSVRTFGIDYSPSFYFLMKQPPCLQALSVSFDDGLDGYLSDHYFNSFRLAFFF
jgi:hypothetical protein